MTIGIAAHGPSAGRAIVAGLAAAERIGSGAIGGFVSLAVIGRDGTVHRAETQRGGSVGLLAGAGLAPVIAEAHLAVLMSSGPDRPLPLSQFTPADPALGLVTGHRFPNMPGADGAPLNQSVLGRMRAGIPVDAAVAAALADNPRADAGLIALARDGSIAAGNSLYLATFPDLGAAELCSPRDPRLVVAVLHNAIAPRRGLALVVAETALAVIDPPSTEIGHVRIRAGLPVWTSDRRAIRVDRSGEAVAIEVGTALGTGSRMDLGFGPNASIWVADQPVGTALVEPYMVVEDGHLVSVDGLPDIVIPFARATPP